MTVPNKINMVRYFKVEEVRIKMKYTTTEYVKRINDLYVMYRGKYLLQSKDGQGYITVKKQLVDWQVEQHIKQSITLGVFAGKTYNKFMCFDIDCKERSRKVTYELIDCLKNNYGISDNQILVSFSGSKGYHVELFFENAIPVIELKRFYAMVITNIGADHTEVEFRNTYNQAVKLPLSINRKTGQRCYLVDTLYLNEVADTYLFEVQQIDTEFFLEQLNDFWDENVQPTNKALTLDHGVAEQFEQTASEMKHYVSVDYETRAIDMINEKRLLYPSSRHHSTLLLGAYYKGLGYELVECRQMVSEILENTWHTARYLYSKDTTLELIDSETRRILQIVYEKGYQFGQQVQKPIKVNKSDILSILQPDKLALRQLLFTMICHSKRFSANDGQFYMTYKQMSEMGNTDNNKRLASYITELSDQGYIEIVRRNERKEKSYLSQPNVYRIKIDQTAIDDDVRYVELTDITTDDFSRVVQQLLTKAEIKQHFTRHLIKKLFSTAV